MAARSSYLAHGIQRACQRCDIPIAELKKLIKAGELTPVVIGNRILLREHDLVNLLRRRRMQAEQVQVLEGFSAD